MRFLKNLWIVVSSTIAAAALVAYPGMGVLMVAGVEGPVEAGPTLLLIGATVGLIGSVAFLSREERPRRRTLESLWIVLASTVATAVLG